MKDINRLDVKELFMKGYKVIDLLTEAQNTISDAERWAEENEETFKTISPFLSIITTSINSVRHDIALESIKAAEENLKEFNKILSDYDLPQELRKRLESISLPKEIRPKHFFEIKPSREEYEEYKKQVEDVCSCVTAVMSTIHRSYKTSRILQAMKED